MRARRLLPRRTLHAIAAVLVTLGALVLADLVSVTVPAPASDRPLHHGRVGFRNVDPDYAYSLTSRIAHVVGRPPAPPRGRPLEVVPNDGSTLRSPLATPLMTWIGHSTFLVQLDDINLLTDPIWSERTSPVAFAGPRRLVPAGLRFEDLPPGGTFELNREPFHEPPDRLMAEALRQGLEEHVAQLSPGPTIRW